MDTMEYATFRYDTIRLKWKTGFTMNSQYSRSLVGDDYSENSMQSHADNSIAIQERDECSSSEDEQSSITSENSAMEEIHSWTTLINASKRPRSWHSMKGFYKRFSCRITTKVRLSRRPLKKFYLYSKRNLAMSTNLTWMKALKKDPSAKRSWRPEMIMSTTICLIQMKL